MEELKLSAFNARYFAVIPRVCMTAGTTVVSLESWRCESLLLTVAFRVGGGRGGGVKFKVEANTVSPFGSWWSTDKLRELQHELATRVRDYGDEPTFDKLAELWRGIVTTCTPDLPIVDTNSEDKENVPEPRARDSART